MKVQEIANTYGVDRDYFLGWLEGSGYQFKRKMMDIDVDDSQNIAEIVAKFKDFVAASARALTKYSYFGNAALIFTRFCFW